MAPGKREKALIRGDVKPQNDRERKYLQEHRQKKEEKERQFREFCQSDDRYWRPSSPRRAHIPSPQRQHSRRRDRSPREHRQSDDRYWRPSSPHRARVPSPQRRHSPRRGRSPREHHKVDNRYWRPCSPHRARASSPQRQHSRRRGRSPRQSQLHVEQICGIKRKYPSTFDEYPSSQNSEILQGNSNPPQYTSHIMTPATSRLGDNGSQKADGSDTHNSSKPKASQPPNRPQILSCTSQDLGDGFFLAEPASVDVDQFSIPAGPPPSEEVSGDSHPSSKNASNDSIRGDVSHALRDQTAEDEVSHLPLEDDEDIDEDMARMGFIYDPVLDATHNTGTERVEYVPVAGVEKEMALANSVSLLVREEMRNSIETAAISGQITAQSVRQVLDAFDKAAQEEGRSPRQFHRKISLDPSLDLYHVLGEESILSLYYDREHEIESWYTDDVVHGILKLESNNVTETPVYYWTEAMQYLLSVESDTLDEEMAKLASQLDQAKLGNCPQFGWPLPDYENPSKKIFCALNPTKNHWIGLEIEICNPLTIKVYNSMFQRWVSAKRLARKIQMLVQIASHRPDFPMVDFTSQVPKIELVECPQQAAQNVDCGPFSVFFITQRMHRLPVAVPQLDTEDRRHAFGQKLRQNCAEFVADHFTGSPTLTLQEYFNLKISPVQGQLHAGSAAASPVTSTTRSGESGPSKGRGFHMERKDAQLIVRPSVGLNDEDVTTASAAQAVPTLQHGVKGFWQFQFGENMGSKSWVIMILRWSGYTQTRASIDSEILEPEIENLARWHWKKYTAAHPEDKRVCIVLAMDTVQTRYMPSLDGGVSDLGLEEQGLGEISDAGAPAANEVSIGNHQEQNLSVSLTCPYTDCDYMLYREIIGNHYKTCASMKTLFLRHVCKHMLPSVEKSNGSFRCLHAGCDHRRFIRKTELCSHYGTHHISAYEKAMIDVPIQHNNCRECGNNSTHSWTFEDWTNSVKHIVPLGKVTCPYCGADRKSVVKYKSKYDLWRHMRLEHDLETVPVPEGWFRCTKLMQSIEGPTMCLEHSQSQKDLEMHMETNHESLSLDLDWSIRGNQKEESKVRVNRIRAAQLTHKIEQYLVCGDNDEAPTILSIGVDAFTCNGPLLCSWTKTIQRPYNICIEVSEDTWLDRQYLQLVNGVYWGHYESSILLTSLRGGPNTPPEYHNLLDAWRLLQLGKDIQKAVVRTRNQIKTWRAIKLVEDLL